MEGLEDLRRDQRYSAEHPVVIKLKGDDEQTCLCESRDLSVNGIKLVLRAPVSVGEKIPLEVFFDGENITAYVDGCVRWCLEIDDFPTYIAGIEILAIRGLSTKRWQALIKSRDK